MLDRINSDIAGVAPYNVSPGPRLGFLAGLEAAWEAQTRASSLDGLAWYFSKADDEQAERARKSGADYKPLYSVVVPAPEGSDPIPMGWRAYRDIARQLIDGAETPYSDVLIEHTRNLTKLNEKHPGLGLKPLSELFEGVRKQAQEAERRANLDHTVMGSVGAFIGDVAGGVDPRTNLLNFMTLPLGGAGKTVVSRIATQAGAQGVVETLNQVTGVQENRRLLGLEHGAANALWNIGGAVVGGAVIQGAGEAAFAGVRRWRTGRWFADDPADPPPPAPTQTTAPRSTPEFEAAWARLSQPQQQSPLYASRMGSVRADMDIDHVRAALGDWAGPRPWEIPPPSETRIPNAPLFDYTLPTTVNRGFDSVDDIARRVDPELFNKYDKLVAIREDLRAQVNDVDFINKSADSAGATATIRAQMAELRRQTEIASGRAKRKAEQRLAELERDYVERFAGVDGPSSPADVQAGLRRRLMETDEQLRDLAPAIGRAYAHAQGTWEVHKPMYDAIDAMVRKGDKGVGDVKSPLPDVDIGKLFTSGFFDAVPETRTVQGGLKPGETLAQAVQRHATENEKIVSEALDNFRTQVAKVTDAEKLVAERERLDGTIKSAEEKLAKLKGQERDVAAAKLAALKEEREALDVYTIVVDGKEYKLHMDNDKITIPTDDGGTRVVTAREMLREIEDDNLALQAVTTCSLKGTS